MTDHRMVLSVSAQQSTLYDQIQYQGSPKEFAWILPIAGEVEVGVSADSLFKGLDSLTSVFVQQPPQNCPQPPSSCFRNASSSSSGASGTSGFGGSASPPAAFNDAGVAIIKEEVVGPYKTAQIHPLSSTDSAAVFKWLADNGYNVTADIKPIIDYYTSQSLDFLALKLKPGAGIQSMRPIRVTTTKAGFMLPLRMVAAGAGASVGITLWVIASGRYEPTNFDSFLIKSEDISWDWDKGASDYKDLRAQRQAAANGKTWEIESAVSTFSGQIDNAARQAAFRTGAYDDKSDYIDFKNKDDTTTTAVDARKGDYDTLLKGLDNGGQIRVTRMRADLSKEALASDLTVGASAAQEDVPQTRVVTREKSEPLCPVFINCEYTGEQLPREQARRKSTGPNGSPIGSADGGTTTGNDTNGTFTCTTSGSGANAGSAAGLALLAVVVGRVVRKRRRS